MFREFRRNLYITLAKYLEQEGVYVSVVTCGRALVCACRYVGVGVRVCRYVCVCTRACRVCVCVFFLTGRTWGERADAYQL